VDKITWGGGIFQKKLIKKFLLTAFGGKAGQGILF
jgi:hypothetical protein